MAASRSTFGPYVIHEELGVGGMATVHRAELPGIEGFSKQVALKRMLPALADSEEGLSSFLREAQLASYLHHANVALTYELGQINGTYFIAMELIDGHSLHDIIARCAETASPMPVAVACSLIAQILDALDYAHNLCDHSGQPLGIIHRDVSPSNVIVADTGIAKLIDFGIAKASAAGMQTMSLTLKGKWAYMAPEYVELGEIDARADLFAVGVIAHELLVCRPLFSAADDLSTLTRLRTMDIPPPSRVNPSVPAELDHVVMAALARNPDERWQAAAAMRNALAVVSKRLGLEVPHTEIASWMAELFGAFASLDDAATIASPAAFVDPLDGYKPRAASERATAPVRAYNPPPPEEELLELAPEPAPRTPARTATPPAASPVVPAADPRPLAQILNDTALVRSLDDAPPGAAASSRNAPRASTGAEPLWDLGGLDIQPKRRRNEPTTAPAVVVTVHDKKKPREPMADGTKRALIIVAALLVTLGLAAAAYVLFG